MPTHDTALERVARPTEKDLLFLDGFLGRHLLDFAFGVSTDSSESEGDTEGVQSIIRAEEGSGKFEGSTCCRARKSGYRERREKKNGMSGGGRGEGGVAAESADFAATLLTRVPWCGALRWAARAGMKRTHSLGRRDRQDCVDNRRLHMDDEFFFLSLGEGSRAYASSEHVTYVSSQGWRCPDAGAAECSSAMPTERRERYIGT